MEATFHYSRVRDNKIKATAHARKRCAQRAINPEALPLIKAYGEKSFDGRGGVRYLMTRHATEKLMRVCGATENLGRLTGVYVVLDAATTNTVITMGHRS